MNNRPAITILTPVWNGLPYIKECVASVLDQKFDDWELIIGDNCSTDGTKEFLDTLTDKRIRVFKQDKNLGIFGNLNFLVKQVKAPIVQILCADDYFFDQLSLKTIVDYWKDVSSEIGFVRFNHQEPAHSKTIKLQQRILPEIIEPDDAAIYYYVFGNIPGNLSNVSFRSDLVESVGLFREDLPFAGDFEYWLRASMKVKTGVRDEMVIYVRRHQNVASNYLNQKGELISQKHKIIEELFKILLKKYPRDKALLKSMGTLNYDSLTRDVALRVWLKGNKIYLRELNNVNANAKYMYGNVGRWFYFLASLGGRLGRDIVANNLIKNTIDKHN